MNEQKVRVGLLSSPCISLYLHGNYSSSQGLLSGEIVRDIQSLKEPLLLTPENDDNCVEVRNVTIGVNFHWQRRENQRFRGEVYLLPVEGEITVINILDVETYLKSVISSEMSSTSSIELLKAHAVISRSWLMSQIKNSQQNISDMSSECNDDKIIRWYNHTDHKYFDVCADDHCQRYQGITRETTPKGSQAVRETQGQVLTYNGELCDARFSKCCGGVMEVFESCWEDEHKDYLKGQRDYVDHADFPDLTQEEEARKWIEGSPAAFCNTQDSEILSQVLVGYDQETTDFYRWSVEYDADELSALIRQKSGIDFGRIIALEPLERGVSGRIVQLKIIGERQTLIVGKELEIRRWLSPSHLYSSAFVIDKLPNGFRLKGAGWGHGVGLCQIGAAMMAAKGYDYRQILEHYYPGAVIQVL